MTAHTPAALPLEVARPGELACWHCRALVDNAAQAHGDEAYQRRCLYGLNLPPFYPGSRGQLCLLHTIVAVANDRGVIAAELARRTAS